jgi:hypothetical protein
MKKGSERRERILLFFILKERFIWKIHFELIKRKEKREMIFILFIY